MSQARFRILSFVVMRGAQFAVTAAGAVITARFLGPHERGVLAEFVALSTGIGLGVSLGVPVGLARRASQDGLEVTIARLRCVAIVMFAVSATVCAVFVWAVDSAMSSFGTAATLTVAANAAAVGIWPGLFAASNAIGNESFTKRWSVVAATVTVTATVGVAWAGRSGWLTALSLVGVNVIATAIAFGVLGGWRVRIRVDIPWSVLRFGLKYHVGSGSWEASMRAPLLIAAAVLGASDAGQWAVAFSLASMTQVFPRAVSELSFADAASSREPITNLAAGVSIVGAFFGLAIYMLAPSLLRTAFGPAFLPSLPALRTLAFGIPIWSLVQVEHQRLAGGGGVNVVVASGTLALLSSLILSTIAVNIGSLAALSMGVVLSLHIAALPFLVALAKDRFQVVRERGT